MSDVKKQNRKDGPGALKRVLIASANPLFAKGLMKIYGERWGSNAVELSLAISMGETLSRLDEWEPDMVIVDYDDRTIHREEFLSHFIYGDRPMQVVLVSLQASGEVVVYDRRTMTPAQAEDWLTLPWKPAETPFVKTPPRRREDFMKGSGKHFVLVGLLVVAMTALIYLGMRSINLLPTAAAVQAETIDRLFYVHVFMIALLFSLISAFIIYSIFVFRAKPGDQSAGAFFKGNSRLEVFWTVIPLITVITFSFFGARNLAETRRVDPEAMVVKVTASSWAWQFDYPDYGIKARELVLPVNEQVLLRLTSRDVIHSFWVPEFRVKQDALPGENLVKELRITPIKVGEYTVMCAELCGGAHADMVAPVKVVSEAEFQAWVAEQMGKAVEDPLERGGTYIEAGGCLTCHSVDGTRLSGPTLKGLYGSQRELENADNVNADEAYLVKAILDPNAQIVKGYAPNVHPGDYASVLTEQQVNDMVEYIKSLK